MRRTHEELHAVLAPFIDELLTPALVVDLDAVEHNVRTMIAASGGPERWRPHIKTFKQAKVLEILAAHGVYTTKCATLDELDLILGTARSTGMQDRVDTLLAYPLSAPAFTRFAASVANAPLATVALLADGPDHLLQIAQSCRAHGLRQQRVYLDVDLGMCRSGTPPQAWQEWLAASEVDREPVRGQVQIVGLHGYDGHIRIDQRSDAHAGYDRLCALADAPVWSQQNLTLLTSGTHSFAHALAHAGLWAGPWRTQITPGTVVFSDLRSHAAVARLGLRDAALVLTRVISSREGRFTVDAGTKAIAPDVRDDRCAILGFPQWRPARASEEHLEFEGPAEESDRWSPGQALWLVPAHVCTTVNLHRSALYLRGGLVVGEGAVASGHPVWRASSPFAHEGVARIATSPTESSKGRQLGGPPPL